MTSVPPEPPAGSEPSATPPPPPPPPAAPAPPPPLPAQPAQGVGGGRVDLAAIKPYDWGILAAGLLAFIFSFVSYYTASLGPISASINAWHGFFGWFAMLVALLSSVLLAVHLFAPQLRLPVPVRMTVLGGYALAALCVILAGLIDAESVPSPASSGRGAGYYLSLIVILAGATLAFLRLRQTGGKLPWEKSA